MSLVEAAQLRCAQTARRGDVLQPVAYVEHGGPRGPRGATARARAFEVFEGVCQFAAVLSMRPHCSSALPASASTEPCRCVKRWQRGGKRRGAGDVAGLRWSRHSTSSAQTPLRSSRARASRTLRVGRRPGQCANGPARRHGRGSPSGLAGQLGGDAAGHFVEPGSGLGVAPLAGRAARAADRRCGGAPRLPGETSGRQRAGSASRVRRNAATSGSSAAIGPAPRPARPRTPGRARRRHRAARAPIPVRPGVGEVERVPLEDVLRKRGVKVLPIPAARARRARLRGQPGEPVLRSGPPACAAAAEAQPRPSWPRPSRSSGTRAAAGCRRSADSLAAAVAAWPAPARPATRSSSATSRPRRGQRTRRRRRDARRRTAGADRPARRRPRPGAARRASAARRQRTRGSAHRGWRGQPDTGRRSRSPPDRRARPPSTVSSANAGGYRPRCVRWGRVRAAGRPARPGLTAAAPAGRSPAPRAAGSTAANGAAGHRRDVRRRRDRGRRRAAEVGEQA